MKDADVAIGGACNEFPLVVPGEVIDVSVVEVADGSDRLGLLG